MPEKHPSEKSKAEPVIVTPVAFRPRAGGRTPVLRKAMKALAAAAAAAALIGLAGALWFVATARQVILSLDPAPDVLAISGGIAAPRVGDHYLLRPGTYTLRTARECYHELREEFTVGEAERQTVRFQLSKLPGRLRIAAHRLDQPAETIPGVAVRVNDRPVGDTPITSLEVPPGRARIEIKSERFLSVPLDLEVEGCGRTQEVAVALTPNTATVALNSIPPGADVTVDGRAAGRTPLEMELASGPHEVVVSAEGRKPWRGRVEVAAGQPLALPEIRLEPADGRLAIRSTPPGASVLIGKRYAGRTPLEIDAPPGRTLQVQLTKEGYETASRSATVAGGETQSLTVELVPRVGIVRLKVEPAEAEIVVDGTAQGRVPEQLRLSAVEHTIEIRKEGYESFRRRITPRPELPQELAVVLKRAGSTALKPAAAVIRARNGYELKAITPGAFNMGSSRREQGRRSNEILRRVRLVRPFAIGLREVTNREFREFLRDHSSGTINAQDLNRDDLPAVMVSWEQAALFCNWLSVREALPPAYIQKAGRIVAADPLGTGYRLPTEAEWEFCARAGGTARYPWGNAYPPGAGAGNYADESAKGLLDAIIEGYNDGYPAAAPAGKFRPNAYGLFDMGGNAAEWCHDAYAIEPLAEGEERVDPAGPAEGAHRVVKGASWKSFALTQLRIAYRDYSAAGRVDLGFRVCRYLE
jgi:formylglycine-generating enzyme required for sulfatase activity